MHLDYIDDLPFEYLISDVNKDIKLSDEIKNEFNHYYINIRNSNNKDIDRWTQEAKRLKKLVELEILESGNQKSIYVTEYVQFIFGVSNDLDLFTNISSTDKKRFVKTCSKQHMSYMSRRRNLAKIRKKVGA